MLIIIRMNVDWLGDCQMQTNKIMTKGKLDEIARVRYGFVAVMLAASVLCLVIDLFFV